MNLQAAQFTYNPNTKTYVAEASELGLPVGLLPRELTIDGASFVYSHAERDASEEDIAGWNFKVTMGAVQRNPGMAGAKVLIIND